MGGNRLSGSSEMGVDLRVDFNETRVSNFESGLKKGRKNSKLLFNLG